MNVDTYYSILEWQGEDPTKIDSATGQQLGRKIFEQDIALGKAVWVDNKCRDFCYFAMYRDPILFCLSNLKRIEYNTILVVLLSILNLSCLLATAAASFSFRELRTEVSQVTQSLLAAEHSQIDTRELLSMMAMALVNGGILCVVTLQWRRLETQKHQSMLVVHQNSITILLFTLCGICMGYYFVMNELEFFSWFIAIYVMQFLFAWSFEFVGLYVLFVRQWKYDHRMTQLIPNYFHDGSFSHCSLPKCVYYITFKDYLEWRAHQQHKNDAGMSTRANTDDDTETDEHLDKPLLITTTML
eukprot:CAMPEP_0202694160 /NCGR_PEP_ID=MMETSP1385-20130828/8091_1 /ASSEMBLY_ACC=CAM_ASM_000861 /TAXON_ID=933848 /ORGANISM="Elphidium margaritaceum" /LENGTH=299 /DNA_ID=CAMNT_0049349955 /DNA_START=76 /DNA_END=975 /DNA_ORIENTATION=-